MATSGLLLALIPRLPGHIFLLLTMLCLAWANASGTRTESNPAIPTMIKLPAGASLIGIVADEPVCIRTPTGKRAWKFPLEAERIRAGWTNDWADVAGKVRISLYTDTSGQVPAYGERWRLSGYLNQTTYKQGLFAGRPGSLFFAGTARNARHLESDQGNSLVKVCLRGRIRAGRLLSHGISDCPEQMCILNSILLGYYSQIPRNLYQTFANTGTLHVFAISGSHVAIILGTIIFILAACGLPRTRWVLFLGPLLILYTAMTGMQPSAVRACIMGIVYWMAPLLGRKPDIFTTLAVAAILILLVKPGDLINIGFILSFTAVLGLVLFCPVFSGLLKTCFAHDPLKLDPDPKWQANLRAAWHHFSDLLSVSTAAWLVTMPLTLVFFGNFSPIGLPANLLVVPLSSLVIITGVLSLTLGSCFLFLADLFNHANLALITLMTESAKWFAAVPYGYMKVPQVPLWPVLVFYAALVVIRFWIWVVAKEKPMAVEGEE